MKYVRFKPEFSQDEMVAITLKVVDLAGELGISYIEKDIQLHDVINADEAFESSTPFCILPVTKINTETIGNGQPGPTFTKLIVRWGKKVGVNILTQIENDHP